MGRRALHCASQVFSIFTSLLQRKRRFLSHQNISSLLQAAWQLQGRRISANRTQSEYHVPLDRRRIYARLRPQSHFTYIAPRKQKRNMASTRVCWSSTKAMHLHARNRSRSYHAKTRSDDLHYLRQNLDHILHSLRTVRAGLSTCITMDKNSVRQA